MQMAAHVERRIWEAEGSEKRERIQAMFDEIATDYDRLNSILSLSRHRSWRRIAVSKLGLQPGDRALDICCGTGDFITALRKAVGSTGRVVGVDFSRAMLEIAASKGHQELMVGDALSLPIQSDAVDAVTVGWGIRNVPDIDAAHREVIRVLKPGGRFVSLDMAVPRNPWIRSVSQFICHKLAPKAGALFGVKEAYTYLPESTQRFWDRQRLADSMARAGFTQVRFEDLFFGNICIHFGCKPETS